METVQSQAKELQTMDQELKSKDRMIRKLMAGHAKALRNLGNPSAAVIEKPKVSDTRFNTNVKRR